MSIQPIEEDAPNSIVLNTTTWQALRMYPDETPARLELQKNLKTRVKQMLMGPKTVENTPATYGVTMRRSRLQYEAHIVPYIDEARNGFDVSVPVHQFKMRITCSSDLPEEGTVAPWAELMENLCKIDAMIIKHRKSKSQPLSFVRDSPPIASVKVEVLGKTLTASQDPPLALPPGN